MTISRKVFAIATVFVAGVAWAGPEKDCLLTGTVTHGDQPGVDNTSVKIHSVSKYDDSANCRVRSGQKLEFKLPADSRLQEAPSGSEVKYRYQDDGAGSTSTSLISVDA